MTLVRSVCTDLAGGWKEVARLGHWGGRRGASGRVPTDSAEASQFALLGNWKSLSGASEACQHRVTHFWTSSWMQSEEITVFLVWQKFPSHYSHFSLIFHHLVQVLVLTGLLLDPPSSADVGSSWERGVFSNLPVSLLSPIHLWVPEGGIFQKRLPLVP